MTLPAHLAVAGLVRDGIRHGVYPVGSTLPTPVQLAQTYETSETAVRAALRELRAEGLVAGAPARVVAEPGRWFSG